MRTGNQKETRTVKIKVLIVEDELLLRDFLTIVLTEAGYEVVEATHGSQALEQLAAGLKVDLVISDYNLGEGLTGKELFQNLRLQGFDIPFIFLSGLMTPDRKQELLSVGAVAALAKPYNIGELLKAVKESVQHQVA